MAFSVQLEWRNGHKTFFTWHLVTLCVSVQDPPLTSIVTGRMWPGDDREWFSKRKDFILLSGCQTIETSNIELSITLCHQQDKKTLQRPAAWRAHARPPKRDGCRRGASPSKEKSTHVLTTSHDHSECQTKTEITSNHRAACTVKLETNYV